MFKLYTGEAGYNRVCLLKAMTPSFSRRSIIEYTVSRIFESGSEMLLIGGYMVDGLDVVSAGRRFVICTEFWFFLVKNRAYVPSR